MKSSTKEKMDKIKEQILDISALVSAIGFLFATIKPIADFVLTVLFK
ncbi:hypothetical protein [Acetoanaerobium noterae]